MNEKEIKQAAMIKNLPEPGGISPEKFMEALFDGMLEHGLYTDVITRNIEAKSWDHPHNTKEEWRNFLRRYRRFLSRMVSELEFHAKLYNYLIDELHME